MYQTIIFLDIDGVLVNDFKHNNRIILNYQDEGVEHSVNYAHLDPQCVGELNRITKSTGAKLCLSSTWRIGPPAEFELTKRHFKFEGIEGEFVGRTPTAGECGSWGIRGLEIQYWLDRNPTDKFVIIDDSSDMEHLTPRLVRTQPEDGLTKSDANIAIEMLK